MAQDGPLLVGIDAGTTNVKVIAVEADGGRIVAEAAEPTPAVHPRPEWAHYEPEALWRAVATALRRVTAAVDEPSRIVAVAAASMAETAVPLDAGGTPTHEAIAWFDKRSTPQLGQLLERLGADRLFAISGLTAQPIFGLCKIMWLRERAPEAYARTVRWLNVADFVAWRLCGVAATDYSLAARTFALDLGTLAWSDEAIEAAGVRRSLLQPLVASGTPLGGVTPEAAAETGLPTSCLVAAGGHDHPVGAFGVGALRPGVLLDSMGTTEAFLLSVDGPHTDPGVGRQGFSIGVLAVDRPYYFVVGGIFTAGAAIEWFRQSFAGSAPYGELTAEAEGVPPGSLGVGFLPHLRLGPPPNPSSYARGAFWGLSTDVTRGVLFRALIEGLNFEARQCADAMMALPGAEPVETVLAIGGGSQDPLRMRIKAALWRRPIDAVDLTEGVSLGAAALAGLAAGVYPDVPSALAALRPSTRRVEPDAALGDLYNRLYEEVYRAALDRLLPLHEAARRVLGDGDA